MPWRIRTEPYYVLVSEVMLQQTQVSRVIPKFNDFIHSFPNIETLAKASQADVLAAWQGLGYYRRAKFLHQAAKQIMAKHNGQVPQTLEQLQQLPGVGHNTAAAIAVYAYNQPHVFIETNIRSVYIHHFFNDSHDVDDKQLLPLIKQTLDTSNPREWYWALMDYGAHIKTLVPNPSRRSKHHSMQSSYQGSTRQMRAKILKLLLAKNTLNISELKTEINDERLPAVLEGLVKEGFIRQKGKQILIKQ